MQDLAQNNNPSDSVSANNKRIAKNTLMLYFRQILILFVALYSSRVLLRVLGSSDYGLYNVVGGVVTLFSFFNSAMVSATQRFLANDLGQKNWAHLRITFNATRIIHLGLAIFIFIIAETIGLWFVKTYLVIPADRLNAALWVYHFAILSFLITVIQVPYNSLIIAEERMNVFAYISILEAILKLTIILILPYMQIIADPLISYGIMLLGVALVIAIIYRIYVRLNFSSSRFLWVKDKQYYKELLCYSGWNIFGNLAAVLKGQGVNMLMNMFFGTVVNAAQAIANQVTGALNSFYINFQMASNPQIIKSYASNEIEQQLFLVNRTAKFSFFLLLILSIPILVETNYILEKWLINPPEYTTIFIQIVLINSLLDCISGPLMTAIQATGKIKTYQAVVGILLMINLPITYLFYKLGFPPQTSYWISICISILALVFRLILTHHQIHEFQPLIFLKQVLLTCITIAVLSIPIPFIISLYVPQGIIRFALTSIISFICTFTLIYTLGLSNSEKQYLKLRLSKITPMK